MAQRRVRSDRIGARRVRTMFTCNSTDPDPGRFDFSGLADSYDQWFETAIGRLYDCLEKRAVLRMLPSPVNGTRLLDVGCGTGHWSSFFADRGFQITGVDVSKEMVAAARRKRIANATFEVADAHALPFDDEAFDVTTAITMLEFAHDAEAVVREMARCTRRDGGVLLIGVLNALARLNEDRKATGESPYAEARFFTPREAEVLLSPYGTPRVTVAAHVPRWSILRHLGGLYDRVASSYRGQRGALLVGRIER